MIESLMAAAILFAGVLAIVTRRNGREARDQLRGSGHFDPLPMAMEAATALTAMAARRREMAVSTTEPRVTAAKLQIGR